MDPGQRPSCWCTHLLYPLQICFLMAVNVIGQRMNFMVIFHGCWLVAILTRRRREAIARLWPNYCLFLTLFLLYQYLLCLGMPPALCIGKSRAEGLGVCGRVETPGLFPRSPSTPTFPPREPVISAVICIFSRDHLSHSRDISHGPGSRLAS